MHILMLVPHLGLQGPVSKHTPHLVAALQELGCEVTIESWGAHRNAETLLAKSMDRMSDIARIRNRLARERFDVLVVKTAHDWATLVRDIPLLAVVRGLCPKLAIQLHGSSSDRLVSPGHKAFKLATRCLLHLTDATLVLSSEEQRQWRQFYPHGRFYTVSNPFLPADNFLPASTNLPRTVPDDEPLLLFVGRLIQSKGIFDLFDAMPLILKRTACRLLVIGDGPQKQQLQEYASVLELTERITLAGYLVGEQLAMAYRAADVCVLPTYHREGFPTVISEAMYAGLPIVTTRIRGAADHLQEDVNALFVPPRDSAALAEAITRLLLNPALRAQMGQVNREKVKDFAPDKVGRQYLDVLEQIVGEAK